MVQQDEESAVVVANDTILSVDAATVYLNSHSYQSTLEQLQSNANDPQISPPAASDNDSKYFTSLKNELSVLLRRSLLVATRDYNQAVYPFLRYMCDAWLLEIVSWWLILCVALGLVCHHRIVLR